MAEVMVHLAPSIVGCLAWKRPPRVTLHRSTKVRFEHVIRGRIRDQVADLKKAMCISKAYASAVRGLPKSVKILLGLTWPNIDCVLVKFDLSPDLLEILGIHDIIIKTMNQIPNEFVGPFLSHALAYSKPNIGVFDSSAFGMSSVRGLPEGVPDELYARAVQYVGVQAPLRVAHLQVRLKAGNLVCFVDDTDDYESYDKHREFALQVGRDTLMIAESDVDEEWWFLVVIPDEYLALLAQVVGDRLTESHRFGESFHCDLQGLGDLVAPIAPMTRKRAAEFVYVG